MCNLARNAYCINVVKPVIFRNLISTTEALFTQTLLWNLCCIQVGKYLSKANGPLIIMFGYAYFIQQYVTVGIFSYCQSVIIIAKEQYKLIRLDK